MLTFHGHPATFCDGLTRRNALQLGGLGMAGFAGHFGVGLDQVLRARDAQPTSARKTTSVIFIELAGGPTQFETYDPKPNAPKEYRGAFGVVQTNLPGVIFSEWMPRQAALAAGAEGALVDAVAQRLIANGNIKAEAAALVMRELVAEVKP